jgi:hypothetical protein
MAASQLTCHHRLPTPVRAPCQLRVVRATGYAALPRPPAARPSAPPYLAVAGSYLLLTVVGLRHVDFDSLGGVLLGAVILTCLVSARQFAALRDYGRLAVATGGHRGPVRR